MKKNLITTVMVAMLISGLAISAHAATLDVTETDITAVGPTTITGPVTVSEGIKDTDDMVITVPKGIIVMWSGAIVDIPFGWGLCDGTVYPTPGGNVTTPNLVDRFILGADLTTQDTIGDGLSSTLGHAITPDEMPSHNHALKGNGVNIVDGQATGPTMSGKGASWHPSTFTLPRAEVTNTGGSGAHYHGITDYKPKYYALAYIMKL